MFKLCKSEVQPSLTAFFKSDKGKTCVSVWLQEAFIFLLAFKTKL